MESIALDMDDMFDNRMDHDDEGDVNYGHRRGLPDLEDETGEQNANDGAEADEVLANLKNLKGAAKKKVTRPQPKLDSLRLQTDRGLPLLPSLFSNVKFKGKGHEAEDLAFMMNKLEHWAHRLFPKLSFDDFIERLERLGNKREIQTCLKRIRLDMPVVDGDVVDDDDNVGNTVIQNAESGNSVDDLMDGMNVDEAYDAMMRREREAAGIVTTAAASTSAAAVNSSAATSAACSAQPGQTSVRQTGPDHAVVIQGLTPEQRERIERNRRMAMEKRAKRIGLPISQVTPGSPSTMTPSQRDESERVEVSQRDESERVATSRQDESQTVATSQQDESESVEMSQRDESKVPLLSSSRASDDSSVSQTLEGNKSNSNPSYEPKSVTDVLTDEAM